MGETKDEQYPEEQYRDMVDLQVTEHATIRAESELLCADISTYENDALECGISVTQDGGRISLSAGTVNQEETPHLYAWCGLTPEQARNVAEGLVEAAENAEEAIEAIEEPEGDTEGFLRRLMP